jgi:hypothetical protein
MYCVVPKFLFALQKQEGSDSDKSFQTLSQFIQCEPSATYFLLTDILGNFVSSMLRVRWVQEM